MFISTLFGIAQQSASHKFLHWMFRLGGLGLIPLGIIDNSVIPVAGSMDVVTVLLCAQGKQWWPYYAFMATLGSLIGGYITYRLTRTESKSHLAKLFSRSKAKGFKNLFGKWGFSAIAVPAVLPPPFPIVPFLIAAGATQYPRGKFIGALAIGRAIRYTILGILGYLYGRWILEVMRAHVLLIVGVGVGLVLASVSLAIFRLRHDSAYAH
ncbi:MAG TPA: VTT domain-containing protein [Candidatus Acidoferrales bacterium]